MVVLFLFSEKTWYKSFRTAVTKQVGQLMSQSQNRRWLSNDYITVRFFTQAHSTRRNSDIYTAYWHWPLNFDLVLRNWLKTFYLDFLTNKNAGDFPYLLEHLVFRRKAEYPNGLGLLTSKLFLWLVKCQTYCVLMAPLFLYPASYNIFIGVISVT